MAEPFDAIEFFGYAQRNWRIPALCCGTAVLLALVASALLPKRYTATASVLIEPPAGNDPRAATAVSPVYLESLKTFERIASSDSLFLDALEHLRIAEGRSGRSVESLKREILEVSKPPTTSILEIKATLHDARAAQALAQYLAERTIGLRQSLDQGSEEDVIGEAARTLAAARIRMERAQAARDAFTASEPVEALDDEVTNNGEVLLRLRRDLSTARAELAGFEAQLREPGAANGSDPEWIANEIAGARARVKQYEEQDSELSRAVSAETNLLEKRKNRREVREAELGAARVEYESAETKVSDIRSSAMFRGERLQLIDPGIVPRSPSSPNLPLNGIAALLLAMVASTVYLAVRFALSRPRMRRGEPAYPARYSA
jgi:capsular polysaccharide biosynthesis protein